MSGNPGEADLHRAFLESSEKSCHLGSEIEGGYRPVQDLRGFAVNAVVPPDVRERGDSAEPLLPCGLFQVAFIAFQKKGLHLLL